MQTASAPPFPHCSQTGYQAVFRFAALDFPPLPFSSSYDRRCSFSSVIIPAASTAEMWTKASLPPTSLVMKP